MRQTPHGKGLGRLERAVAVAQQHRHRVVAVVGGDDVGVAIAKVRDRHRIRITPHGKGLGRLEGAVAVAQQHRHRVVAIVGGDDVGVAVAKVRHRHRIRITPHGKGRGGWKVPSPLPSNTDTVLSPSLAVTMSGWPLPRSATATASGPCPTAKA